MRFEDLVQASEVSGVINYSRLLVDTEAPEEDALASLEGPPQERIIQVVLQFNEGPGGLPSQSSLCHTGTVKVGR